MSKPTFEEWKAEFFRQLRAFGYAQQLTDDELSELYEEQATPEQAYWIDSDVANGFSFKDACQENLQ